MNRVGGIAIDEPRALSAVAAFFRELRGDDGVVNRETATAACAAIIRQMARGNCTPSPVVAQAVVLMLEAMEREGTAP